MERTIKKITTNKYVLYLVLFLAITNVLGYLSIQDFKSLTIFAVVGIITFHMTKNMTIVLLTTMLTTSFIMILERKSAIKEAMSGSMKESFRNSKKKTVQDKVNNNKRRRRESLANRQTSKKKEGLSNKTGGNKVDYESTVEEAYDNLNAILGGKGMEALTNDTQNLMKKQEQLVGTMKKLEPMIGNAQKMIEGLNIEKFSGLFEQFAGKSK